MDIQIRKLKAIENLMDINDEELLKQIELFINEIHKQQKENRFRKLTKEQIIDRAKKSNEDYNQGKTQTQEELECINRGLKDFEEGKSHSHETARKIYEKYL
ncbi:MAG: hypothetical protein K9J27_08190 [Bacteroidales bacterium]|nr:hypothetical protein [Bacteroidales bacterium]MCF8334010.1 hypothetical protein [Bacteroidales bacterium]